MTIRPETSLDCDAIRSVICEAFHQSDEADLVEALRTARVLEISLVAKEDNSIVGHIALSKLKSPANSLALAPVCVVGNQQGRGIGSSLIQTAVAEARSRGFSMIFVLGDPDYYSRFGFSTELAEGFPCEYSGSFFMALPIGKEHLEPTSVIYPKAFGGM